MGNHLMNRERKTFSWRQRKVALSELFVLDVGSLSDRKKRKTCKCVQKLTRVLTRNVLHIFIISEIIGNMFKHSS